MVRCGAGVDAGSMVARGRGCAGLQRWGRTQATSRARGHAHLWWRRCSDAGGVGTGAAAARARSCTGRRRRLARRQRPTVWSRTPAAVGVCGDGPCTPTTSRAHFVSGVYCGTIIVNPVFGF
uniref:Uncharacterized protein n=1 Tax=Arundo donax TaxID=35708 RepID=A0A0A9HFL5_ARUDO